MKRKILAAFSALLVMALVLQIPVAFAAENEDTVIDTKTYYYDRISEEVQKCYLFLKEIYDSELLQSYAEILVTEHRVPEGADRYGEADLEWIDYGREGTYAIVFSLNHWLPEGSTGEADYNQLLEYFLIADIALKADDPTYEWKGYVTGGGSGASGLVLEVQKTAILTKEAEEQAYARIDQIVAVAGHGDRYTQLRKMCDYLIRNSFYDPYSPDGANQNLEDRSFHYSYDGGGLLYKNIAGTDSYAKGVKILCDALDIPCIIMGDVVCSYNLVQMEDGGWYRLEFSLISPYGYGNPFQQDINFYFSNVFLNNDAYVWLEPYMISVNNVHYVTEFPELASGQYRYTGDNRDYSYTVEEIARPQGEDAFAYLVNMDQTSCTITDYLGEETGDLIIPETLDGYTVTGIAGCAFYCCVGFDGTLVIPDTVQVIENRAFAGCSGLTAVKLPAELHKLGESAFAGCKGLKEVVLPDLLDEIGERAFYDCVNLVNVTFGAHVQQVGNEAFLNVDRNAAFVAPEQSEAQFYAQANGLGFRAGGTLCQWNDPDGNWEFDTENHFHTCEHGARFDYSRHDEGPCFEPCSVCGSTHEQWLHDWTARKNEHYRNCGCGMRLGMEPHWGGEATATKYAICDGCGLEYGELDPNNPDPTEPPATTPASTPGSPQQKTEKPDNGQDSLIILICVIAGVVAAGICAAIILLRKKRSKKN